MYEKDILIQLTRIAKSLEKISNRIDTDKTLDGQGLPNCWRCKMYDKDFGTCFYRRHIVDLAENTCGGFERRD